MIKKQLLALHFIVALLISCSDDPTSNNDDVQMWELVTKLNDPIITLAHDNQGNIIAGSIDGFLYKINQSNNQVDSLFTNKNNLGASAGFVNDIKLISNNIWFAHESIGVYRYSDIDNTWNQIKSGSYFYAVGSNSKGQVFITQEYGILKVNSVSFSIDYLQNHASFGGFFKCILVNSEDEIITASTSGAIIFSTDNGETWSKNINGLNDAISNFWLMGSQSMVFDKNEDIILGSEKGVYKLHEKNGDWIYLGLSDVYITSVVCDNSNGIYVGAFSNPYAQININGGQGVYYSPNGGVDWNYISAELPSQNPYALCTNSGILYVALDSGEIYKYKGITD